MIVDTPGFNCLDKKIVLEVFLSKHSSPSPQVPEALPSKSSSVPASPSPPLSAKRKHEETTNQIQKKRFNETALASSR